MTALHFSQKDFVEKVLDSKGLVLVDFYAQWCGPCKLVGPVIDELAEEYKGKMLVGKVDVGKEQKLASDYKVMSIPTVIIFKDGKEVERKVGFPGKEGFEDMIKKYL